MNYEIHARKQFEGFLTTDKRWSIAVTHRRAGKTVACVQKAMIAALKCTKPEGRFGYVAPLFNQAKDAAWLYLKHYAAAIPGATLNESELRVEVPSRNGSARIRLYGADNPDRLRGMYFDGCVLDEFADQRPSVWGEIIRPMLADRQGWAAFIGTPKGHNEFHALWIRALADPSWYAFMLKASESGLISDEELASARHDMTPEQYEQEWECSFEAAILGSYYGKEMAQAERDGRITDVPYEPAMPVQTAWDLGIGDSTAIWFFQTIGSEIRIIDFYENHSQGLSHYAAVLAARGYTYGSPDGGGYDWVPHDAQARELGTGKTRVETLVGLGRKPRLVAMHEVEDGINAARLTLPRCWFDRDKCKDGLEALRQYRTEFDEKTKAFKDKPRHDWTSHTADAFRYLAIRYREFLAPASKPKKPTHVVYEVKPDGRVEANVSVWDAVEILKRRKRRADG